MCTYKNCRCSKCDLIFERQRIMAAQVRWAREIFNRLCPDLLTWNLALSQVALKRQQAVEDAIALRLASNETGKLMEALPQGKIFGMNVTEPKAEKDLTTIAIDSSSGDHESRSKSTKDENSQKSTTTTPLSPNISQNAIEMLSSLFPHRKRSVLELVLRRCDSDLLRLVRYSGWAPLWLRTFFIFHFFIDIYFFECEKFAI